MLKKYIVTGVKLFLHDGRKCEPGEVIELPTQMAGHPVALGVLAPAPPDAEVAAAAPPQAASKAAKGKSKAKPK